MAALLPLRCPSCGASIQVPGNLQHLTCAYCHGQLVLRSEGGAAFLEQDAAAIRAGVGRIGTRVEDLHALATRSSEMLDLVHLRQRRTELQQALDRTRAGCGTLVLVLVGLSLLGVADSGPSIGLLVLAATAVGYLVGVAGPRRRLRAQIADVERRIGELDRDES